MSELKRLREALRANDEFNGNVSQEHYDIRCDRSGMSKSEQIVIVELSCGHRAAALRVHGERVRGSRHCGRCRRTVLVLEDLEAPTKKEQE